MKRFILSLGGISFAIIPITTISAKLNDKNTDKLPFEINDIKVFGFDGEGYVKVDEEQLSYNDVSNFQYTIYNSQGIEKENYKITNLDKIVYSYVYNGKKYTHESIVNGLVKSSVNEILKVHKKYIQEAIKSLETTSINKILTKWKYFEVVKVGTFSSKNLDIFKVTTNKNIKKYNIKKGQSFYMANKTYNNSIQIGEILFGNNSNSYFGEGNAEPNFWNYNDDDSFATKLYIALNLKEGESFLINSIINNLVISGLRTHLINKISTRITIPAVFTKRIISRKNQVLPLNINQNFKSIWFDKSESFGIDTFFEGLIGGIGTALSAPFDLVTGLTMSGLLGDLDYLFLAIDEITQNTSGLNRGISLEKAKAFQWTSFAIGLASLPFSGGSILGRAATRVSKFIKIANKGNKITRLSKITTKISKLLKTKQVKILKFLQNIGVNINKLLKEHGLNEKNLEKWNDKKLQDKLIQFSQNFLKKIGKYNLSVMFREENEKKIYDNVMRKIGVLRNRGLVFSTDEIPKLYSFNNPVLKERINTEFNSSSKSFWNKTHVSMKYDKAKTKIIFVGKRTILSSIDLNSILSLEKNMLKTQKLIKDSIRQRELIRQREIIRQRELARQEKSSWSSSYRDEFGIRYKGIRPRQKLQHGETLEEYLTFLNNYYGKNINEKE